MLNEVDIEVTGLDELDRKMAEFSSEFNRVAVAGGVEAAAAFMAARAKQNAPEMTEEFGNRKPGELRESIGVVMRKLSVDHPNLTSAWVGPIYGVTGEVNPNQDPAYWGQYVEFGSAHNPTPKSFLRRSVDEGTTEAVDVFVKTTSSYFEK